jgi:enoyl-[acyl-carrier protein] reductase I
MSSKYSPHLLEGKKGLILGIANEQSIAWGCAKEMVTCGAKVVASCLNDKARAHVEHLTNPLDIKLVNCNVESPIELEHFVQVGLDTLGSFDFVIHSIAFAPLEDLHGKVVDSSAPGFARAMDVSCHSFARFAKLCSPHMNRGGSMLAMTYLGSSEVVPHYGIMGPVKAALESMVRYLAAELGPNGIRVHAVSPGPLLTRAASGIEGLSELMRSSAIKAPLKRLATLQEVSDLCVFLCSDASSGMTGQTIFVDAGTHAVD